MVLFRFFGLFVFIGGGGWSGICFFFQIHSLCFRLSPSSEKIYPVPPFLQVFHFHFPGERLQSLADILILCVEYGLSQVRSLLQGTTKFKPFGVFFLELPETAISTSNVNCTIRRANLQFSSSRIKNIIEAAYNFY